MDGLISVRQRPNSMRYTSSFVLKARLIFSNFSKLFIEDLMNNDEELLDCGGWTILYIISQGKVKVKEQLFLYIWNTTSKWELPCASFDANQAVFKVGRRLNNVCI